MSTVVARPGRTTATGHVVGARYFSASERTRYEVLGPATIWELAPDGAVRLRWANGNITTTSAPVGRDVLLVEASDVSEDESAVA